MDKECGNCGMMNGEIKTNGYCSKCDETLGERDFYITLSSIKKVKATSFNEAYDIADIHRDDFVECQDEYGNDNQLG